MKSLTLLLIISCLFFLQGNSQNPARFNWHLQYSDTKIHLNHSDIGVWIEDIDSIMDKASAIKVVPDRHAAFIKSDFISFERNKGALIKIDIASNHELVGHANRLLIVREAQNDIIGYIEIPIGSDQPIIDAYNSRGQLLVGGDYETVNLVGTNLDGVIELVSDGNTIIDQINSLDRDDRSIAVKLKANYNGFLSNTSFSCKYLEFDPASKAIVEKTTPNFNTNIGVYRSSVIELEPSLNDVYATDIINNGGLRLRVTNGANSLSTVDFGNLRIAQQEVLAAGSWIRVTSANEAELNLVFKDVQSLVGKKVFIEFDLVGSNQRYRVGFSLLPDPVITAIENSKGDQKYVISKELEQVIIVKGKDVSNLSIVPVRPDLFDVHFRGAVSTEKEFLLVLKTDDFAPRSFNFNVMRGSVVLKTFSLSFDEPRMPQKISTLFSLIQGSKVFPPDSNEVDIYVNSNADDVKLVFDPAKLKSGYGKQSVNIKIAYYNPNNTLIANVDVLSNGNSSVIIRDGGNPFTVELSVKNNFDDYIRPWGRADITISHTADFYKQQLDLKEVYVRRVNFIGKSRTSITAALTIPPALVVYGVTSGRPVELLPINVGFGLNFAFRKNEVNNFARRNFELGTYLAGLNFAGTNPTGAVEEGDDTFIKKGDIAVLALGQFNLRRTDTFVKIPILIGPGVTLPVNGKSSKFFFALGVGVNF